MNDKIKFIPIAALETIENTLEMFIHREDDDDLSIIRLNNP